MDTIVSFVSDWVNSVMASGWRWFSLLTREEWLVVLAACTAACFLCMRGYGSRSKF